MLLALLMMFFFVLLIGTVFLGSKVLKSAHPRLEEEGVKKQLSMFFLFASILSWVVVMFLWGIEERGIYALGMNMTLCIWGVVGFYMIHRVIVARTMSSVSLAMLLSILAIGLSYMLYDNTYLNTISALMLPFFILFVWIPYDLYGSKIFKGMQGGKYLPMLASSLNGIGGVYGRFMRPRSDGGTLKRVFLGIVVLVMLCIGIVLPLLMSADKDFADAVKNVFAFIDIAHIFPAIRRLVAFGIILIILLAMSVYWLRDRENVSVKEEMKKLHDPIIGGIVLGGIFLIYGIFIVFQIDHLFSATLPQSFKETEALVKGGFWQLFVLTAFNAVLFMVMYTRTTKTITKILFGFTLASLILIFSAAQRLFVYVTLYGLSYEKFFASYTALYSIILFAWLLWALLQNKKRNVMKFIVVSGFCLYALATLLPVEKIILHKNIELAQHPGSRISLIEMRMLSTDVLSDVKDNYDVLTYQIGISHEESSRVTMQENGYYTVSDSEELWDQWIERRERILADKKWYEKNIGGLINKE